MSKELEALEIIGKLYLINDEQVKDWDKRDFNILKSALKRLEAIDNANPSEALKELELVENWIRDRELKSSKVIEPSLAIIKQALIKAEKEHNSINLLMQELDCNDLHLERVE